MHVQGALVAHHVVQACERLGLALVLELGLGFGLLRSRFKDRVANEPARVSVGARGITFRVRVSRFGVRVSRDGYRVSVRVRVRERVLIGGLDRVRVRVGVRFREA